MKILDKFMVRIAKGSSTVCMTEQVGKDVILLYYTKLADSEIKVAIDEKITRQIEKMAKSAIKTKALKTYIEKKSDEVFERFLKKTDES